MGGEGEQHNTIQLQKPGCRAAVEMRPAKTSEWGPYIIYTAKFLRNCCSMQKRLLYLKECSSNFMPARQTHRTRPGTVLYTGLFILLRPAFFTSL
jgi:hypothetical protein